MVVTQPGYLQTLKTLSWFYLGDKHLYLQSVLLLNSLSQIGARVLHSTIHSGSGRSGKVGYTFPLVTEPQGWILGGGQGFSSVQFSHSVVSDSSWHHESQHARPPCPSPSPGIHSNSHPSSWWCHPAISSSVVPFSSCPNPSQHQSLFQWVNSSHEVAKVLEFQL